MIVKQEQQGIVMLGKVDNIFELLKKAVDSGFGNLPAAWALKLYLKRN